MKEQDYQKKIINYLEGIGAYVVKVSVASKKGVPDIIACYRGRFLGIEVKTPLTRKNTTKLQEYNLKKIKESHGLSLVAVDVEDIYSALAVIDSEATSHLQCLSPISFHSKVS